MTAGVTLAHRGLYEYRVISAVSLAWRSNRRGAIDSVFGVFEVDPTDQDDLEPEDVIEPFKLMVARWVVGITACVTWEASR